MEIKETIWTLKVKGQQSFLIDPDAPENEWLKSVGDQLYTNELPQYYHVSSKEELEQYRISKGLDQFEVVEVEITYKVKL